MGKENVKIIFNGATWINDKTGDSMFIFVDTTSHELKRVAGCSNTTSFELCTIEEAIKKLTEMGYHYVKDKV